MRLATRLHAVGLCLTLVGSASSAPPILAQGCNATDSSRSSAPWLKAVSVGLPSYGSETAAELFTLGLQFTQMRPGRISGDFSIGTMPYLVAYGIGVLGLRGGLALPMEMAPGSYVIPSAGVSSVMGISPYGGGAVLGTNLGMAVVLGGKGGGGMRAGVTWHRFMDDENAVMLVELGVLTGRSRQTKQAAKRP